MNEIRGADPFEAAKPRSRNSWRLLWCCKPPQRVARSFATRPAGITSRLWWLRRFAPAGVMDAGIRKNLRLDALRDSMPPTAVLEK
jgi:hypothetical protein